MNQKVKIGDKLRADKKVRTIKPEETQQEYLRKPDWIRVRVPNNGMIEKVRETVHSRKLHTVCEEAACPNLPECFGHGTATFMILGDICTRRCAFCDVGFGRPGAIDPLEPAHLAESIDVMGLKYVVITSVDRDDLPDAGAGHFANCIRAIRKRTPNTLIEVLTPDFRPCLDLALDILVATPPDVFNHNVETVPRLYKSIRPGARLDHSLTLLQRYKQARPEIPTKSGLMVGLGETFEEVIELLGMLHQHKVDRITIGQYLQPSKFHAPVKRYVHPDEFAEYARIARDMGFGHVASGPMVRSSYHADLQNQGIDVGSAGANR
jgi:lipoic acid synthetase